MRTGLTKQEKTTDIWFDEKDPLPANRKAQEATLSCGRRCFRRAIKWSFRRDRRPPVSYTHLDVYKRQITTCVCVSVCICFPKIVNLNKNLSDFPTIWYLYTLFFIHEY